MNPPGLQQPTPPSSVDIDSDIGQKYIRYSFLSERRAIRLRQFSDEEMTRAYDQASTIYKANPSRYPPTIPVQAHTPNEAAYWAKCESLTPDNMSEDDSLSALECALQFFVCTNAMQAIMQMYLDNGSAPRTQELRGAWSREVGKRIRQYREERGIVKRSLRREQTSLHRFVHRIIKVNDAGTVKQYSVDDAVTSHNRGTTFHLRDLNNPEQIFKLSPDAFEEMVKGALSISDIVDVPVDNDT